MAGGNFMHRVLSYIVNELVVDRLANSRSFQRFAVKSSKAFEEISQRALQQREKFFEQLEEASKTFKAETEKGSRDQNRR